MTEMRVAPGVTTSPMFRVRGQRSRWLYPDQERATPEHCEILRNVNISERGIAESRYGYTKYNTSTLGELPVGLWEGTFLAQGARKVVVTPDKVYNDTGTGGRTDITGSDLTGGNDDRVQFAFIKDTLIINNGVDHPRKWNGNTSSNTADLGGLAGASNISFLKAKGMLVHKNVLILWGTTEGAGSGTYYPTRVRYCDVNRKNYEVDIETWRQDNRYEIYDGGPAIVGAVDAWGLALFFKEDGLYPGEIFYGELGLYDFRLGRPQRGFSPVSKTGIVSRPEFIAGVAKEGIFVVSPDLEYSIVSNDNTDEWLGLNTGRHAHVHGFVRERDHQVRWLCPSVDHTDGHNRILVWDWDTGDMWIDEPSDNINVAETVTVSNKELDWLGGADGFLYQGNETTSTDDDGDPYEWRIKMHPNDLGLPGKKKHILNIRTFNRVRFKQSTVTMNLHIDEGRDAGKQSQISTTSGQLWNDGTTIWDDGALSIWPPGTSNRLDFEVNRICETIAPEWKSTSPAGIEGYQVEYILLEN